MELLVIGIFISADFLLVIISFFLGYSFANNKVEPIKKEFKIIPKAKKEKKDKKADDGFEEFDEATRIMLLNIDNYDGTGLGQQDVPESEEEW